MSSESAAVENLRTKIGKYLRETVGSYEVTKDGSYSLRHGSTKLLVKPVGLPNTDKTIVSILAFVTIDVNMNNDLMKYIMDANTNLIFGKLVFLEDQKLIVFQHSLLGDKLDPEELMAGIGAVAFSADKYDDEIRSKFGGKRVTDAENEALKRFSDGYAGGTMRSPL